MVEACASYITRVTVRVTAALFGGFRGFNYEGLEGQLLNVGHEEERGVLTAP